MHILSPKSYMALHTSGGGGMKLRVNLFFFLSDNNLQFLQDTNYLAGTHCTVLDPERTSWESISPWENLFFKLNSSFLKIKLFSPLQIPESPEQMTLDITYSNSSY